MQNFILLSLICLASLVVQCSVVVQDALRLVKVGELEPSAYLAQ